MLDQLIDFVFARWVIPLPLQAFVKNSSHPCCVVVPVKGIAIDGERRLVGHAGISHKSMFNCAF
jgi:hypothetical protein